MAEDLRERGFTVVSKRREVERGEPDETWCRERALSRVVMNLVQGGWPAVFIFMFNDAWEVLEEPWNHASEVLGIDCVLEPTVYAWCCAPPSRHPHSAGGGGQTQARPYTHHPMSLNFGLPHRDYGYEEAHTSDGNPALLCCWIPLSDATPQTGCLVRFRMRAHSQTLQTTTDMLPPGLLWVGNE